MVDKIRDRQKGGRADGRTDIQVKNQRDPPYFRNITFTSDGQYVKFLPTLNSPLALSTAKLCETFQIPVCELHRQRCIKH